MIRALIVDDEPPARRGIAARLTRAGDVQVVRQCGNGREAVKAIRELMPDLVFLDVQMPGVDGFGVVEAIGPLAMPAVIFVTAYDANAVKAFDAEAVDFLLKPIDDDRFARALARARRRLEERTQQAMGVRVAAVLAQLGRGTAPVAAAPGPGRLMIRDAGRVVFLESDEVDWVAAEGDYVRVHAGGRSHLVRETMQAMEARLSATQFARVHRSTLVNVARISELRPLTGREWLVVLDTGAELRLSRRYRDRLAQQTGLEF